MASSLCVCHMHRTSLPRSLEPKPRTSYLRLSNSELLALIEPLMKSYTYLLAAASFAASANAADLTWDITPGTVGAGDSAITGGAGTWDNTLGNWTTNAGANNILWDNTANATDTAVFSGTGGTVNVGTPINLGGLRFTGAGYTVSGSALTFGSVQGSINTSAVGTGSNQTTIASNLIGTGGLTIAANGDLSASGGGSTARLNLTGDNTGLTGGIAITGGLVSFGSSSAAGSAATTAGSGNALTLSNGGGVLAAGTLTLGNNVSLDATGGTFRVFGSQTLTLNGVISGSGGFNKTDSGTLRLVGVNTFSGPLNVNAGILTVGANTTATGTGSLTVNTGATLNAFALSGTGSTNFANTSISLNGGTMAFGGSSSVNTQTYTFNGLGSNAIQMNNSTLTFSSDNNTTKRFQGALNLTGSNSINYTAGNFSNTLLFQRAITGSGTLSFNFTANGGSVGRTITIDTGLANNFTGSVVLNNVGTASSGVANFNLASSLGASGYEIRNGWRLNNNVSGGLNSANSITLSHATSQLNLINNGWNNSAGTLTITNGTVNLGSSSSSIGNLTGAAGTIQGNNNITDTAINASFTVNQTSDGTYAGTLSQSADDTLTFTKNGNATLTLTGTNTYTGSTSVNGGKLLFNGNSSGATGTATVASGATIGGSGSYGGALNVTGTLAPGASIESFATGAVTLNNGSAFEYEFNSSALNGDLLVVNGTLDLSGSVGLNLLDLGSGLLNIGDKLTLINYSGAWNGGLFNGIADDSVVTVGGNSWLINYNDTTGGTNFTGDLTGSNFVTMTVVDAIPEPSVALLGGLGALALLRRRRN